MNGPELKARCEEAAVLAVAKAIHRCKRNEFHERFPKGECPLCSVVQNAVARSGLAEKINKMVMEGQ